MNILDVKESKIKAYLKYLSSHGATSKTKAVEIVEVERSLRMDDKMFDEITRYLLAQGFTSRTPGRTIYITRSGVNHLNS